MKISTARLKQIIHEELFYREFHRKTEELTEEKEDMMSQPTFDAKVAWVKRNKPEIENPEGYVAAAMRKVGELK